MKLKSILTVSDNDIENVIKYANDAISEILERETEGCDAEFRSRMGITALSVVCDNLAYLFNVERHP